MTARRLSALDEARGVALVAMAVFHMVYDLTLFGFLPSDTMRSDFWRFYAVATAASFLFMAGIGLWLAHGEGIRWRAFFQRLCRIILAAVGVSAATYIAMPHAFVQFGILHSIALSSLAGLAFLRLPVWSGLAAAVIVLFVPLMGKSDRFDTPWLLWTGLSATRPPSLDYEPFFPWFAAFLMGLTVARMLTGRVTPFGPDRIASRSWSRAALIWLGRHSLLVYLVHQPILLAAIWALSGMFGLLQ